MAIWPHFLQILLVLAALFGIISCLIALKSTIHERKYCVFFIFETLVHMYVQPSDTDKIEKRPIRCLQFKIWFVMQLLLQLLLNISIIVTTTAFTFAERCASNTSFVTLAPSCAYLEVAAGRVIAHASCQNYHVRAISSHTFAWPRWSYHTTAGWSLSKSWMYIRIEFENATEWAFRCCRAHVQQGWQGQ